jgi:hypothetical protein
MEQLGVGVRRVGFAAVAYGVRTYNATTRQMGPQEMRQTPNVGSRAKAVQIGLHLAGAIMFPLEGVSKYRGTLIEWIEVSIEVPA